MGGLKFDSRQVIRIYRGEMDRKAFLLKLLKLYMEDIKRGVEKRDRRQDNV